MKKNEDKGRERIRLNKYLSQVGFCSRREADRLIEAGKVTVDSQTASIGDTVCGTELIMVEEKPVGLKKHPMVLAFYKPKGLVCTTAKFDKRNIIDYLNLDYRVFPIGRLDKDSHGLLLLTNDGEIVNKILKSGNYHEKEYLVRVNRKVDNDFLKNMSRGVRIVDSEKGIDTVTAPCKCERVDEFHFKIILTQGINRQIRRMCEALGYRVLDLKRIRIMKIQLGNLKAGEYKRLNRSQMEGLMRDLRESEN